MRVEPSAVAAKGAHQQKFGGQPKVIEGLLRIEREKGHEFIPQLVSAFPGQITSITLGKPTLEDVFIHRTGHKFWNEEALLAQEAGKKKAKKKR